MSPAEKYGLIGLAALVRASEKDSSSLALGTDLTTLGLNLNSPEYAVLAVVAPFHVSFA